MRYGLFIILVISICLSCSKEENTEVNYGPNAYESFLKTISKNDSILIVPLNEFETTIDSNKIILALRHDVDAKIESALKMAELEYKYNVRSTYFILHTASYYLIDPKNKSIRNRAILDYLKKIQDDYNHEIGIHNDLVTLQVIYNLNPREYLFNELNWLRNNNIRIYGTASHGADECKKYKYLNYYFFKECNFVHPDYPNMDTVPKKNKKIVLLKGNFQEFNLNYEAYFIKNCTYYSENGAIYTDQMFHIQRWKRGDRIVILTHPQYW